MSGGEMRTPPLAPADAVFAVKTAFENCELPDKVSLGVGAYRGEDGEPLVLSAVVEAKKRFAERLSQDWRHECTVFRLP